MKHKMIIKKWKGIRFEEPIRLESPRFFFHGSNAKLLDDGLVAGTFFTEDLEIALKYGQTIYVVDLSKPMYRRPIGLIFEFVPYQEYFVSSCFIPLENLIVLKEELIKPDVLSLVLVEYCLVHQKEHYFECPVCSCTHEIVNVKPQFCSNCGQKLIWREE